MTNDPNTLLALAQQLQAIPGGSLKPVQIAIICDWANAVAAGGIAVTDLTTFTKYPVAADSVTTASYLPAPNQLILATVIGVPSTAGAQLAPPSSVSGNGLTWVMIASANFNSGSIINTPIESNISLWRAMGPSPVAGALTATWGTTILQAIVKVVELNNVNTTGTNGSGAIVQSGVVSNGTATTVGLTLANPLSAATNCVFAASANWTNPYGATAQAGWVKDMDVGIGASGPASVATGGCITYQLNATSNVIAFTGPGGSDAKDNWGLIAIEIAS